MGSKRATCRSPPLIAGSPKEAKSSGRPAVSPTASPSLAPRSAASASSAAKAVVTAAGVVRSSFEALPLSDKEAVAVLLSKLEAAVIPDDFALHRMMVPPSHGTGAIRVDLTVNHTGKVTGGAVSSCILLPIALLKETHDYMFLSAKVPAGTGCFSFSVSLARSVGFRVIKDAVLLASDTGDPIILHVSLMPPDGTLLTTVRDWLSRIEAESTGRICALKAAAEPLWDADGATPPTSPLPWMCCLILQLVSSPASLIH